MVKKSAKSKIKEDLAAQHDAAMRLGTMTQSVASPSPFVRTTTPSIVTRTFTTYSAYEEPIGAE